MDECPSLGRSRATTSHDANGEKALVYLARYLYRGVLAEKNILCCDAGQVTFRYTDNRGASQTRTLAGADFLWLLLQHVLPKGLRRTRDYGFLSANRKRVPIPCRLARDLTADEGPAKRYFLLQVPCQPAGLVQQQG